MRLTKINIFLPLTLAFGVYLGVTERVPWWTLTFIAASWLDITVTLRKKG